MKLVSQIVVHRIFGEGSVVAQDGDRITVRFSERETVFIVPDAFMTFLRCKDADLQADLEAACKLKRDNELKEREAKRREAEQARREAEEKALAEKRRTTSTSNDRHSDENNLAFKCNYCDGGCRSDCLGYKGVCSDGQMKYNIEKKKRAWCSNPDSPCFKYLNGAISREELDALNDNGKFVCYESRMLIEWKAEAGDDLDENGVHKARRITNASRNSLAVLTAELPEMPSGKDRVIFGVFVTGVVDEGDDLKAGYVKAKDDYYIELPPEEAKKMKFWHYYKNANSDKTQWGMGLYRYMKDSVCARILADIVEIKTGEEKRHAQRVLEYYCNIKDIDIENIPAAGGAI